MLVFPHCVAVFYGHIESQFIYFVYSILIGVAYHTGRKIFYRCFIIIIFPPQRGRRGGVKRRDVKIGKYKRKRRGRWKRAGNTKKSNTWRVRAEHGRKLKSYFAVVKFPVMKRVNLVIKQVHLTEVLFLSLFYLFSSSTRHGSSKDYITSRILCKNTRTSRVTFKQNIVVSKHDDNWISVNYTPHV